MDVTFIWDQKALQGWAGTRVAGAGVQFLAGNFKNLVPGPGELIRYRNGHWSEPNKFKYVAILLIFLKYHLENGIDALKGLDGIF